MADPIEPRTETPRIDVRPSAPKQADPNIKQTVRIQLPVHESLNKPPPFSMPLQASITPAPGPKTEVARVSDLTEPTPPLDEMKTALVPTPDAGPRKLLTESAPAEKNRMLIWWLLLGMSAIILIIQIWTYLS